jgi:porin
MIIMTLRTLSVTATGILVMLTVVVPAHAQQPQADQPKAEKEPPGFWHRDTLTGDWGGLRSALADQGIAIPATYTAEVFSNVQGGMKRGSSYDGAFLPQIDVDLDKLMGWQGGSFRASMIQGHGPSMSQG